MSNRCVFFLSPVYGRGWNRVIPIEESGVDVVGCRCGWLVVGGLCVPKPNASFHNPNITHPSLTYIRP